MLGSTNCWAVDDGGEVVERSTARCATRTVQRISHRLPAPLPGCSLRARLLPLPPPHTLALSCDPPMPVFYRGRSTDTLSGLRPFSGIFLP